jgi:hypothetical protein
MSPQDKRPARRSDDPDSTAELPVLADPGLGDPDSWVAPPPVRGTLIDEVLQAHETEIQLLRRELAHSARERAAYESQYHEAIADREEMRQQLDAAEARADDMARQLNDIERSVEERDVRIGELQLDLDDAANAPVAATAAAAPAATAVAAVATDAEHGRAAREDDAELRALRAEIEQLRWRAAAQSEALQSREVRRQVHESQWRELEADVFERDERIRLLEQELATARASARRLASTAAAASAPAVPAPAAAPVPAAPVPAALAAVAAAPGATGHVPAEHDPAAPAVPATTGTGDPAPAPDAAAPGAPAADALAPEPVAQAREARPAEPAAQAMPLEAEPWPPTAGETASEPAPAAPPRRKSGGALAPKTRVADNSAFSATGDFAATGDFSAGQREDQRATRSLVPMLVCIDGDGELVHVLGRRTTVGRTPDNDLRINAEWISRHHAVVLQTKSGTVLEDLNSTNGVLVNGLRVARRQLEVGDVITFGKSNYRYQVKSADAGSA